MDFPDLHILTNSFADLSDGQGAEILRIAFHSITETFSSKDLRHSQAKSSSSYILHRFMFLSFLFQHR